MDKDNLNVSHLAWCGLVALHIARRDGLVTSPAQDNLFLTRWLAIAEKQRRFPRALASDISWLLKEGREKGLRGNLQAQNDLFRLQHALHAVKLTGWIYMVLSENEWSGGRQLRLSPSVSGIYLRRSALDNGFDEHGRQRSPLPVRITGDLVALDKLLQRSGWCRGAAGGSDEHQHLLLADGFSAE